MRHKSGGGFKEMIVVSLKRETNKSGYPQPDSTLFADSCQRLPSKKLGIFGSVAGGKDTAKSDVDILVSFSRSPGLFDFLRLEEYLSRLVNRKVDLVTRNAIKPMIREQVLREVIYV